jgi:hypothetical protein
VDYYTDAMKYAQLRVLSLKAGCSRERWLNVKALNDHEKVGGREGARTPDPLLAKPTFKTLNALSGVA